MSEAKTDTRRLMSAISTLTGDDDRFGPQGRILTDQTSTESVVLSAMVREIGETVLHRRLVFHFENSRPLAIEVAERRVLKVVSDAKHTNAAQASICERDLVAADAGELLEFLVQIAQGETSVSVVSSPLDGFGSDRAAGVSYEALEQRVLAQKEGQVTTPTLSHAVSQTRSLSKACVVFRCGQQISEMGPQAYISGLKQIYQAIVGNTLRDGTKAWMSTKASSQSILRVKCDDVFLLSLIERENLSDCLDVWSALRLASNE